MQFRATITINYQTLTCGNSGLELDRLDRLWRLQAFISACNFQLILLMYKFDPLRPHALLAASSDVKDDDQPIEWEDKVKYRRELRDSHVTDSGN